MTFNSQSNQEPIPMRCAALSLLAGLLVAAPLPAQESQPVELTISPRAIETPLLKYRLFPAEAERKPGNAVPILLRLPWEQTQYMSRVFVTLHEWDSRPLDAPQWPDFPQAFPNRFYSEMKRAAYRRDASWEYPLGEEPAYYILLPDVQGFRTFLGRGLSAKVRYHLTRGELDEARETILVGMANAGHMAQTPIFVNQSVAGAIQRILLDRTAELMSQPDCPNHYWALSTLPDSLLQLERSADMEASMFAMTFPAASDLDRPRGAEEWKKMFDQLVDVMRDAAGDSNIRLRADFIALARDELPGMLDIAADKVAAMSDEEVGVRWLVHTRIHLDQQTAATMSLNPREALPRLAELQQAIEAQERKSGLGGGIHSQPASVYLGLWSVQRKIAVLRIIEAVRAHLAASNGKFPERLEDIRGLSIPLDPLTGLPFEWKVEGPVATLMAPPVPIEIKGTAHLIDYRLRVR